MPVLLGGGTLIAARAKFSPGCCSWPWRKNFRRKRTQRSGDMWLFKEHSGDSTMGHAWAPDAREQGATNRRSKFTSAGGWKKPRALLPMPFTAGGGGAQPYHGSPLSNRTGARNLSEPRVRIVFSFTTSPRTRGAERCSKNVKKPVCRLRERAHGRKMSFCA